MKKLPSIFERIFLSHLLLIAAAFVAVVWLYNYLIGTRYHVLLYREPGVIIPVALLLIGVAGFLAAWVGKAIALPIDRAVERLAGRGGKEPAPRIEEVAELLEGVDAWMKKEREEAAAAGKDPAEGEYPAGEDPYKPVRPAVRELAHLIDEMQEGGADPASVERVRRMKEQIIRLTLLTLRGGRERSGE